MRGSCPRPPPSCGGRAAACCGSAHPGGAASAPPRRATRRHATAMSGRGASRDTPLPDPPPQGGRESGFEMTDAAFAAARLDFPALEHSIYLDVAARGILSRSVRRALDWQLDDAAQHGGRKQLWMAQLEATRARFAGLIRAEPDEIAFTKNVSEGLNMIAAGLPWHPGDNVVVAVEAEHPNNVYAWLNLRRRGVVVKLVPTRNGEIVASSVIDAIDARTRL